MEKDSFQGRIIRMHGIIKHWKCKKSCHRSRYCSQPKKLLTKAAPYFLGAVCLKDYRTAPTPHLPGKSQRGGDISAQTWRKSSKEDCSSEGCCVCSSPEASSSMENSKIWASDKSSWSFPSRGVAREMKLRTKAFNCLSLEIVCNLVDKYAANDKLICVGPHQQRRQMLL